MPDSANVRHAHCSTVKDLAKHLGVDRRTLRDAILAGELRIIPPALANYDAFLVHETDLEEYLDKHAQPVLTPSQRRRRWPWKRGD